MQQTPIEASPGERFRAAVAAEKPLQVVGAINAYTARLAEAYVGPVTDTAYYSEVLPSYGLMDFRMGFGKEPWVLSVFGTNLTNKHAALTIDNTVFAWQQPTITRVSTNQPRTIGLGFETKF